MVRKKGNHHSTRIKESASVSQC